MSSRPAKARQKHKRPPLPTQQQQQQEATPLKLVIRHLPPHLPEKIFHTSIADWHKAIDLFYYVPGKLATNKEETDRFSRAYVKFRKQEDLNDFVKRFQGHQYVSSANREYRAIVELALYQKIAKPLSPTSKARDPLAGTIEQDPEYLAFVESLKAPVTRTVEEVPAGSKVTPLIEYLRMQKSKQDAKSKAKKVKETTTKAKQQEEKQKAAQAHADATTAKIREKTATTNGKASSMKGSAKDSKTETSRSAAVKKPRVTRPKTAGADPSGPRGSVVQSQTSDSAAAIKAVTRKPPTSTLAQQRIPKGQPNTTHLTQAIDAKPSDKSTKPPKKGKRKEPKPSSANGHAKGVASAKSSAPVDISGPTPAEMAALMKAKT